MACRGETKQPVPSTLLVSLWGARRKMLTCLEHHAACLGRVPMRLGVERQRRQCSHRAERGGMTVRQSKHLRTVISKCKRRQRKTYRLPAINRPFAHLPLAFAITLLASYLLVRGTGVCDRRDVGAKLGEDAESWAKMMCSKCNTGRSRWARVGTDDEGDPVVASPPTSAHVVQSAGPDTMDRPMKRSRSFGRDDHRGPDEPLQRGDEAMSVTP